MRLFLNVILSLMLALAPVTPRLALADQSSASEAQIEAFDKQQNSFEVVDLGTEENPMLVLLAHVHERATVAKTMKDIKPAMEDAAREFPDLRFVSITIYPKDDPATLADESKNEPFIHKFWRQASSEKIVADELRLKPRKIHSFQLMEKPINVDRIPDYAQRVIDHTNDVRLGNEEAPSFLTFLTQEDLAELKYSRPRTDITTSLIRGAMTGGGIALGLALTGETDLVEMGKTVLAPTAVAFIAGMKNEWLADFEQTSHYTKLRNWVREKRGQPPAAISKFARPIEGILKNVGLAFSFVAVLKASVLWAESDGSEESAMEIFAETADATKDNIIKKTLLIRALHTWTHKMYKKHPKLAAKFAAINAWSMAFIGGMVTGTDTLRFLEDNPVAQNAIPWIKWGLLFAGATAYIHVEGAISKTVNWTRTRCNALFKKQEE